MNLAIRPAAGHGTKDRAFIVSSWVSSYKSSHFAGILANEDYAGVMYPTIERVLDRPETLSLLACDPDDSNLFLGHIVAEIDPRENRRHQRWDMPILHFVYVKKYERGKGTARALLDAVGIDPQGYFVFTCKTGVVKCIQGGCQCDECLARPKRNNPIPRARFDPNGIRYSKTTRPRAL